MKLAESPRKLMKPTPIVAVTAEATTTTTTTNPPEYDCF